MAMSWLASEVRKVSTDIEIVKQIIYNLMKVPVPTHMRLVRSFSDGTRPRRRLCQWRLPLLRVVGLALISTSARR